MIWLHAASNLYKTKDDFISTFASQIWFLIILTLSTLQKEPNLDAWKYTVNTATHMDTEVYFLFHGVQTNCKANQKQKLNGYICNQNVWYLAKPKNYTEYKICR